MRREQVTLATLAAALVAFPCTADMPGPMRQAELLHMLRHDCGACHGLGLDGGLGPPLTPEAMTRLAPVALERVIRQGRPGTPMPAWKAFLSPAEVRWMAHALRSGEAVR